VTGQATAEWLPLPRGSGSRPESGSEGIDRQLRAHILSPFVGQKLGTWISKERKEDLDALRELLDDGKVKPVVDWTFRLSEVPEAIHYLRDGRARGKVVITV
jgi:NADPH:quinone reductase-like Zn-dependent oxidoreductase